jgi:ribose transport system substrate-binding protein
MRGISTGVRVCPGLATRGPIWRGLTLALWLLGTALLVACERAPSGSAAGTPKASGEPGEASKGTSPPAQVLRIAVVPKGTTHDFWKTVHAGVIKAQRELSSEHRRIEVVFRGPEREDDREQQIALVQNLVNGQFNAIVLAPLDESALIGPARQAMAAKIPVVIIDSALKGEAGKDYVSFIATDNFYGGELAGRHLGLKLGGKGRVLLLRYQEGSASTTQREEGFLKGISEFKDIQVIDPKRYAGATRATAQEASENLLVADRQIDGVFCPNESSVFGMLLALRSHGLAGKVILVGFDASDAAVQAMRQGEIHGLMLQSPMRMGELGVRTAVEYLTTGKVAPLIDTGVVLVTPETMDEPANKEALQPDLAKYLGTPTSGGG